MSKIYLNPGHGGKDPGAVNGSRKESNDVLRLALAVRPLLIEAGHNVVMSRTGDTYTDVSTIAANANASKADYFVALHRNSHKTSSATGIEVLICSKASATARKMAEAILARAIKVGGVNRGVKVQDTRTTVLQKTSMPAVTVELLFISNPNDNALFDSKFNAYAKAIADGICDVAGRIDNASVDETGVSAATAGWEKIDNTWYYFDNDRKLTGWQKLPWSGGLGWFYFDEAGRMLTGWQKLVWHDRLDWYFFAANGVMQASKWVLYNRKWYYMTSNGAMAANRAILNDDKSKVWLVDKDGVCGDQPVLVAI